MITSVDATVFPIDGIRQAPVSPVDGKPMRRIDAEELEVLLDKDQRADGAVSAARRCQRLPIST